MERIVEFRDLEKMDYRSAWDIQEELLQQNVKIKSGNGHLMTQGTDARQEDRSSNPETKNWLLFVEHFPVYTLGKSGHMENMLVNEEEMNKMGIQFFRTNRGGDITFHGGGQIVGYPILDLEKFGTDIGKYLRNLEETIILSLKDFGIEGERSSGETGVWIQPGIVGKQRKICAMGVRCSRWITMHGFALNVNTDLSYFNNIIPCGIQDKQVTSLQKELGGEIEMEEVKTSLKRNFEKVFDSRLIDATKRF
ncbi:MAG: lipoyl(octanoyl) transferase LipB [Chitinophagales bacterium]